MNRFQRQHTYHLQEWLSITTLTMKAKTSVKEPQIINNSTSSHSFNLENRDDGSSSRLPFCKFSTMFCNIKKRIMEEKFEATNW